MRFISVQLTTLLKNDLWRKNADHANQMCARLEKGLKEIPAITFTQARSANAIFAILPAEKIPSLQEKFPFYVWDDSTSEVRLMTSFQTTPEDVDAFIALAREVLK
jgi:threonine aldolase